MQEKVRGLCQTVVDIMRAVFTLKYNYSDKSPNPYKSELTESAIHLIDALERQSRATLRNADEAEPVNDIDGMGVSDALERDVRAHFPKQRVKGNEIGN